MALNELTPVLDYEYSAPSVSIDESARLKREDENRAAEKKASLAAMSDVELISFSKAVSSMDRKWYEPKQLTMGLHTILNVDLLSELIKRELSI